MYSVDDPSRIVIERLVTEMKRLVHLRNKEKEKPSYGFILTFKCDKATLYKRAPVQGAVMYDKEPPAMSSMSGPPSLFN